MNIPLTISETQKSLLEKEFTAVELTEGYLTRINAFDKNLNSYITVSKDIAYKQAKIADRRLSELGKKAFDEYPLLGVTVAHKDMFLTKGVRTTAASKVLNDFVPTYSSTVVKKLEKAGCIMLGKTNHDAWAHGTSGENSDFGMTLNPWNKKHVPGGSSSGSAATTAANLALVSTGTDTGGSIREPANFCGVFGLKPTYGSVSRYGVVAMASSTDSIGHFARTTTDIESIYQVTKGVDGHDSVVRDVAYKSKKANFKIGLPKEYFVDGIEREVKDSVLGSVKALKEFGVEIIDISLPLTKYAVSIYYIIVPAEISSNLSRYDGIRYGNKRSDFSDEAKRRIMLGSYVLSAGYYDAYYLKAMKVRTKMMNDFDRAFEKVDAIIAPVSPTPAFKVGEKVDNPLEMYLADIFTLSANLVGIPALAIPSGLTKNNLPLGFQLMGPRFSEPLLFELGKLYERVVDWRPMVASLID